MTANNPCCAPQNPDKDEKKNSQTPEIETGNAHLETTTLEGGSFMMGTNYPLGYPQDGEGPARKRTVNPFNIDKYAVTNRQFSTFVQETGYITEAEDIGWSFVFAGLLPDDYEETRGVQAAPWWRQVFQASWQTPEGPHSTVNERLEHPVVHISWNDATAYAKWVGGRLPTEAEWEFAARGGLDGSIFPWGDELEPNNQHRMNVWQGSFPDNNLVADGWYGTAPVGTYPLNAYGIGEMTGNVWEWCQDWFAADHGENENNPSGPESGELKVIKGGSYLCHESYCNRYRVAARSSTTPNSAMGHLGFRTVRDLVQETSHV
ncbi:MAG: formylglycine-generating enzyme family protein [Acidimicrobiales bacterium]|jgi:formylglycine-generating enzyme required for sulfatase activity|nr:formylglycine-generating enzyme family protein [Acidimicrobiales bacterium]MDP6299610.1 formylglycine-generating enzyme family protein [Acidimicrobiales bacterium]HJM27751.1 formylglycine-generating enzyme family protein [Acidimicrobiales bacterium]HJM97872.1 formylglycine-generating enzyme family protein [Acidimicrobiales bacterium]